MPNQKSYQQLFQRERRRGDLVFALIFMALSIFLLLQIGTETHWGKKTKLVAQPYFWPMVSLTGMTLFAVFHFLGSILSPRIPGRLQEIGFWLRSLEFVVWFLVYVWVVPIVGYLPSTLIFMPLLVFRAGYHDKKTLLITAGIGFAIVTLFKAFLSVKIPDGALYEYLPDAIRSFMMINF